jgi:mannitol/fructose-specific phosphotransferase system IIA component
MDSNSIPILKNNKPHVTSALQYAINEHNILVKDNNDDRQNYLSTIVEDLKEQNNNEHITVQQLMHREQSRPGVT